MDILQQQFINQEFVLFLITNLFLDILKNNRQIVMKKQEKNKSRKKQKTQILQIQILFNFINSTKIREIYIIFKMNKNESNMMI